MPANMKNKNKKIEFASKQHKDILSQIVQREDYSSEIMAKKFEDWKDSEENYTAYVKETTDDKHRDKKRDDGKPQFTTIQIPFSYAILMSMHTYQANVFLGRNPVFQYTGRHGEPMQKIQAMEAIMEYQVQVGKMLAPMFVWLMDANKYGIGVVGNYWDVEHSAVTETIEEPKRFLGVEIPDGGTTRKRITKKIKSYEGNRVFNVRPYDWRPDPRVPLTHFQKGEFCGIRTKLGWSDFIKGVEDEKYFNKEALMRTMSGNTGNFENDELYDSGVGIRPESFTPGWSAEGDKKKSIDRGMIDIIEMAIKVVPRDWGLGDSRYPEKWVFVIANEQVIISAQPLGALHDKFPYSILEVEMDAYSLFKRGVMEILEPLQDTMDWLVNTHFYNVRSALNMNIVADPSRIVMKDLSGGGAGRIIRTKGMAFGEDVMKAISQLPVTDVTRAHMQDAVTMGEMMQRVMGVNDTIMGMVNEGGRKTATEVRSSSSSSVNRQKTVVEYMSASGWSPLSEMCVSNTQQFYSDEQKFKIAGDTMNVPGAQEGFVTITQKDIAGQFDYVPVDGTMPVDRFAQAQLWKELMEMANTVPAIADRLDLLQVFFYTAQLAGAKNIHQFRVEVASPQQIQQDVASGRSRPIGEANEQNRSAGNPDGSPNRNAEELSARAAQTSNVGRVGPAG